MMIACISLGVLNEKKEEGAVISIQQATAQSSYEKSLCLVNLCSQMDCFSMHASVDKEDMSLSFTVVSKREENIAFFFCKEERGGGKRIGICRRKKKLLAWY